MDSLVKAKLGNLDVIGNGVVHTNTDQSLTLIIGGELEMEFVFVQDKSIKGFITKSKVEDKKWFWILTNYTNPLGTGVITPIEIGTLDGNKLYASFFIWTPEESSEKRIINYVVYIAKEA